MSDFQPASPPLLAPANTKLDRESIGAAIELTGLRTDGLETLTITGRDPIFDAALCLGEGAAVALAMTGLAANRLWVARGFPPQRLEIDVRHAAASLVSFAFLSLDGAELEPFVAPVLTDFFSCQPGRWIHLHGGFDQGRRTLDFLGLKPGADKVEISAATRHHNAFSLEAALAARGLCGAVVRSATEWATSSQGLCLAAQPVVQVTRIGDASPEQPRAGARPLSGTRVLDLTRVLAGPTCARTLAEHGAEVLHLACPRLPTIERFEIDTGHGKRQAYLDLDEPPHCEQLRRLIQSCDVFSQGFRPGALQRRGFGPEEVAKIRPGIIYISESCFGSGGHLGARPGWEQLAQAATGIAMAHGGLTPALIPAAFNDYTTGYLAAAGAMEALHRRSIEGGSWHVEVSLCRTSMWYQQLQLPVSHHAASGFGDLESMMTDRMTAYGPMRFLAPALRMSETSPYYALPASPLGSGDACWLPTP